VILLDPEVAAAFPDSKSVNEALRALLEIADRTSQRKRANLRHRAFAIQALARGEKSLHWEVAD
jgi:hypothetical protein